MRYTYRIRPGRKAERALLAEWHRCRFLWNEAVHLQRTGQRPTLRSLGKMLTEARGRNAWLREGSQKAQSTTLRTYTIALAHSYKVKGRGRPKIKKRRSTLPTLGWDGSQITIRDGRLCLPKMAPIPVVWSRELPSPPGMTQVYQDSLGHWYVSFVVRRPIEHRPATDSAIGIDWGVQTTATTTDPRYDLPYRGHRKRCAAELARAQRKMSRRRRARGVAPSKGYQEARLQVAKLHKKAQRQATHDARVWARKVIDDHGLIAVEDFKPKFLAKSTMAKKAADAAISMTKRELIERAVRAGRQVVMVAPAYTSMTCSRCFERTNQRLGLGERTFRCATCGFTDGRDRNAAKVILAVAERNHAGVEGVRRASLSLVEGGPCAT